MDSILVVIRMTGLLLFTPTAHDSAGPTNVLIPEAPGHVVQIGYHKLDSIGCAHWEDNVCYLNMGRWRVELGSAGNSLRASLPPGNVSRAANRPVHPVHHTHQAQLAARVILNQGKIDTTCALGRFTMGPEYTDSVDLVNVVTWKYRLPAGSRLRLERRPLNAQGNPTPQLIVTPLAATSGVIEIYLRNIPENQQDHDTTGDPMQPGQHAEHMRALFGLLDPPAQGPLPRFERRLRDSCEWAFVAGNKSVRVTDNAGTLSCMVASGSLGP